jgi:hypothetical protein
MTGVETLAPLSELGRWLDRLITTRAKQDEQHRNALRQIYLAVNETRLYLALSPCATVAEQAMPADSCPNAEWDRSCHHTLSQRKP